MKTAPTNNRESKMRAPQPLYGRSTMLGKKDSSYNWRTSLFNPPQNTIKFKRTSTVSNKVYAQKIVPGSKESLRLAGALSATEMHKSDSLNKTFHRPAFDIAAVRQTMAERAQRMAEKSMMKSNDDSIIQKPVKPLFVTHTPKPSTLARVYMQLSESKKKRKAQSKQTANEAPLGDLNVTVVQPVQCEEENIVRRKSSVHKVDVSRIDEKENISANDMSPMKEFLKTSKEKVVDAGKNCALTNILKYCQLYGVKMDGINDALNQLDNSFQRVMVAEVGGKIHEKFCEYQKKKFDLYRELKFLEDNLEKTVTNELDVSTKFAEYIKKRSSILKERSDLQEGFENIVHKLLKKYEEEIAKPPSAGNIDAIMEAILRPKKAENSIKNEEIIIVPRRSKRLQSSKKEMQSPAVVRSASKKVRGSLSGKKNLRSAEKMQKSIYKDLQKTFNLCSPESSF